MSDRILITGVREFGYHGVLDFEKSEGQEFIVNLSGQYPANQKVKAKAGRPPLSSIKTLPEDPVAVEKAAEEIKARYAKIFKV